MNELLATILICAATTAVPDCSRATAIDVITAPVPSLFACMMAGQLAPAHHRMLGNGRYAKVCCGDRARPASRSCSDPGSGAWPKRSRDGSTGRGDEALPADPRPHPRAETWEGRPALAHRMPPYRESSAAGQLCRT